MSKRQESAAERIWREKLDMCMSAEQAIILLVVIAVVFGGFMLVADV